MTLVLLYVFLFLIPLAGLAGFRVLRNHRIYLNELWCLLYPDTRRKIKVRWKIRNANTSLAQADHRNWTRQSDYLIGIGSLETQRRDAIIGSVVENPAPKPATHHACCPCPKCLNDPWKGLPVVTGNTSQERWRSKHGVLHIRNGECREVTCKNLAVTNQTVFEPEFDACVFHDRYRKLGGDWSVEQENEMIRLIRSHQARTKLALSSSPWDLG